MSPVDPLRRVVDRRGLDPERRPTAPPPKRSSGRLAAAKPALAPRPSARPSAAAQAEIEREAQRRRDQAIRDAKANRRAAAAGPASVDTGATNFDREAAAIAHGAPAPAAAEASAPQAAQMTKLRGPRTPEARARMSALMKARWAASRQPAPETAAAAPAPAGPPAVSTLAQAVPPPISWPPGAHVVVERLDVRASEVALEVDMADGFRCRVERSLRPADQSPCVALRLHGVELTGALDPDRARLIAGHLLTAADLAAALLAVPESQLAAAVLGGLVSPA